MVVGVGVGVGVRVERISQGSADSASRGRWGVGGGVERIPKGSADSAGIGPVRCRRIFGQQGDLTAVSLTGKGITLLYPWQAR